MERAETSPPPARAEDSAVSGSRLRTTTASGVTSYVTPSMASTARAASVISVCRRGRCPRRPRRARPSSPLVEPSLQVGAEAGEGVDARGRETEHLGVGLVGEVLNAQGQLEPIEVTRLPQQ